MEIERYRDSIDFIKSYRLAQNAATGSKYDPNANVEHKNITTMTGEIPKGQMIGINRLLMHDKLKKLYGNDVADQYLIDLEDHKIYKHDETSLFSYCVSITMYPYLFNGMKNIGGISEPPKNLQSFCGSFVNLIFAIASQFAGAVSTPEFLTYMDYFIRKEYGDDYYKHPTKVVDLSKKQRTIDNTICQYWQQIVYSLNQPAAARNYQSVFWNIAYFDKPYFNGIFEDFVFPDGSEPKWESVLWLQKRFMNWFNKERLRTILTFPVETVNLLDDGEDFVDKDFADFVAEMWSKGHSFFLYRSNSVDSLASCCYSKDTRVLIRDMFGVHNVTFEEIEAMELKNGTYKIFNNGKWSSGKLVKLPSRQMYKVTLADGREVTVTDNHRNRVLGGMKLTKDLTTDDYQMVAFINDDELPDDVCIFEDGSYYYKIKSIEKVDYDDYVYCFEMDDKNDDMFTLANGIHNYNCRLRNELQDNAFSYTLGAGGVATGSKCVITINFNRLVQDTIKDKNNIDWKAFDEAVRTRVRQVHKYLIAYNEIVKDNLESGILPIYDAGYISMNKQFLTIGINGLVEGAEYLGYEISPRDSRYFDYCTACLKPIYEENKAARTKDLMFNTEYVPRMSGYMAA